MRSSSVSPSPQATHSLARGWRFDAVLAVALGSIFVGPALRVGWLRDDWLLLWANLDPSTAPAGARGSFFRPVADAVWWGATRIGADAPFWMHLSTLVFFVLWLYALARWARRFALDPSARTLALLFVAAHAALLEPRMWAAANNAVVAAAFGAHGALELGASDRRRRALGAILVLLGGLARADAVLWLLWTWGARRRDRRSAAAAGVLGVAALALSLAQAGRWNLDPGKGLSLVGGLLWPWQGLDPRLAGAGALILAAVALRAAGRGSGRAERAAWRVVAWVIAALFAAGSVTSWSPAGRYLVVGVAAAGLGLAAGGRWGKWVLALLAGLHLIAAFAGSAPRALREQAARETALYRVVRALPGEFEEIVLIDPPPLGWTGSAADLENVVSAARRRIVRVVVNGEAEGDARVPVLRWNGRQWSPDSAAEPGPGASGS